MDLFNIHNVLVVIASIAAMIVFFNIQGSASRTTRPASPTRGLAG